MDMVVPLLWSAFYYGWIFFEVCIAIFMRTRQATGSSQDRGTQALLWLIISASITVAEVIRYGKAANIPVAPPTLTLISLVVLLAGLAVRSVAIITLGNAFSANVAIKSSQTIQSNGIYSVVRHPSYSGLLLCLLAIGLHSLNWSGLAIAILPTTAALLYRIRIEEAALSRTFGPEYAAYSLATKRLVPGVY